MRIGILTLPLHTNYGGILQAYALQTVLERMGHEVVHIQEKRRKIRLPLHKIIPVYCKRLFKLIRNGGNGRLLVEKYQNESYDIVGENTHSFIKKHIKVHTVESFSDLRKEEFECIIVGSDQVWRPSYFKKIENAFLDFASNWKVKRIAYAPSLGTTAWTYTKRQTKKCKRLIQLFDIVTVREHDSVQLLKDKLDVNAQWVLDPTLLLQKDDYVSLLKDTPRSQGNLLVYLLDITPEKRAFVKRLADVKGLIPFFVSANPENYNLELKDRIQPPVERWLKGFDDAELVITDSFHACVFSIIFRKPLVVFGNAKRGQGRFLSLFECLGFKGLILNDIRDYNGAYINEVIDYKYLNKRREISMKVLETL